MYYLQIEYGDRIISIPFGKLKDADNYTVQYENREKFLSHIFKMLNLDMSINDIGKVYLVSQDNLYNDFDYETCLPIKYSVHNFNLNSLKSSFIDYLQKEHERIRMFDVVHVKLPYMMNFKDGISDITNDEVRMSVNTYLKDDYKKCRDIYFAICGDVAVRIDKVNIKKDMVVRDDLSKLESSEDDYLQYLIELSSRGDEEGIRAREELSMMDMADVISRLPKAYHGILDGASNLSMINPQDILELEILTGTNIDNLRKIVSKSLGRTR